MQVKRLCKAFILLILTAGIMVSGCKFQGMNILYKLLPGDKYVQMVKSGTMGNYKNVEVGKASEERFTDSDKITAGKKVVVKTFSARVYSQPIGNNGKFVGEVEKFITLPYYNSVKVDGITWYKVHIFDYGCGYVCADEAVLLDDENIIGNVVIRAMDVNIRSKATTHKGNQNVIGSCNKGDSFKCTGLIMDAERNWYRILIPNGQHAYIASEFAGLENPVF